jgi:hypothetical protein
MTEVKTAAQGIETRSAIDAKRRGPKGESPVLEEDAPKPNLSVRNTGDVE